MMKTTVGFNFQVEEDKKGVTPRMITRDLNSSRELLETNQNFKKSPIINENGHVVPT